MLAAGPHLSGPGMGVARADPSRASDGVASASRTGGGEFGGGEFGGQETEDRDRSDQDRSDPGPADRDPDGRNAYPEDLGELAAEIAATRARIDELAHQMARTAEEYNAERIRLAEAERVAKDAAERRSAAEAAVSEALERRRGFASSVYRARGLEQLSVLLTGDPRTALDRAGTVDALARRQREAETDLRLARRDRAEAKQAADAAYEARHGAVALLVERKREIEESSADQQALLDELIAKHAELERQAGEREAAALRARQEAEAAAAAEQARQAAIEVSRLAGEAERVDQAGAAFAATPVSAAPAKPTGGSGGAPRAVQEAHAQIGKPYVWGGSGPDSFDCSGLTQWVWGKAGVGLTHYTGDQWNEGMRVARSELVPGDLVFFGEDLYHVGIYIGDDKMIHAPRTGALVRIESVWWSSFQGGVRPGA